MSKRRLTEQEGKDLLDNIRSKKIGPRIDHKKTLVMDRIRHEPIPDLPKKLIAKGGIF